MRNFERQSQSRAIDQTSIRDCDGAKRPEAAMRPQRFAILNAGLDYALQFFRRLIVRIKGRFFAPVDAKDIFTLEGLFERFMPPRFPGLRPEEASFACTAVSIRHHHSPYSFPPIFQETFRRLGLDGTGSPPGLVGGALQRNRTSVGIHNPRVITPARSCANVR